MKDSVKKWYKDKEASLNVSPPSSVWENIEDQLNAPAESWYKHQEKELSAPTPPNSVWENIETELDSSVESWYKAQSDSLNTTPPSGIWENLESNLETGEIQYLKEKEKDLKIIVPDQVWEELEPQVDAQTKAWYNNGANSIQADVDAGIWPKIASQLAEASRKSSARRFVLRAIAMVTLFIAIPQLLNDSFILEMDTFNTVSTVVANQPSSDRPDENSSSTIDPIITDQRITPQIETSINTVSIAANNRSAGNDSNGITEGSNEPIKLIDSEVQAQVEPTFEIVSSLPGRSIELIPSISASLITAEAPRQRPQLANWSLGPFAYFSGSSLMNPFTRQVILNKDIDGGPNYNLSYGISLSKAINNRSQLIVDLICNDNKTQVVKDLTGNSPVESITQLNYTTASALYKYNLFINKSHRVRMPYFGFSAGPFASINSAITETRNGEEVNFIQDGYRKFDAGIVTAIDFSNPIGSHFTWTIGARMQSGVVNIFKGTHKMPAHFFRTYTTEFGLFTRLTFDIH